MFFTPTQPMRLVIVKSNDKKRARLNAMRHFRRRSTIPTRMKGIILPVDPLIVYASQVLQKTEHILETAAHPDTRVKNGARRSRWRDQSQARRIPFTAFATAG